MTAGAGPREAADASDVWAEGTRIDLETRIQVRNARVGGHASIFRGGGLAFERVRAYVAGDDPRAVDWNVTARMGHPHVKTFREEREHPVAFVVDGSPGMDAGWGAWSLRQAAARCVALLAHAGLRVEDRVGLWHVGGARVEGHRLRRDPGHARSLVHAVLQGPRSLQDQAPTTGLEDGLRAMDAQVRERAFVFVLSSFPSRTAGAALARVGRRHDLIALHLRPAEIELPRVGLLRVQAPGGGGDRWVDTSSSRVRRAWADHVGRERAAVGAMLRTAGGHRVEIDLPRTPRPEAIAEPLLRFFRMRTWRGGSA